MKKVLSVVLAVMMLFSAMVISSSAADSNYVEKPYEPHIPSVALDYVDSLRRYGVIREDQVVIAFDLMNSGAKFKTPVQTYDENTGEFTKTQSITGIYYMVPNNKDLASSSFMTPGTSIILPSVTAPNGKTFKGWKYVDEFGNSSILAAGSVFNIPEGSTSVGVIYLESVLTTGPIEVSFLSTLISKLVEVVSNLFGMDLSFLAGLL